MEAKLQVPRAELNQTTGFGKTAVEDRKVERKTVVQHIKVGPLAVAGSLTQVEAVPGFQAGETAAAHPNSDRTFLAG